MSVLQSLTDDKLLLLARKLHPHILGESYPLGHNTYVTGINKITIYKSYRKNLQACYTVGVKGEKILHHWKNKRSGEGVEELTNREHQLLRVTPEITIVKRHILTQDSISVLMAMKDFFKANVLLIHDYKHEDGITKLKNICTSNGINLFFTFEI